MTVPIAAGTILAALMSLCTGSNAAAQAHSRVLPSRCLDVPSIVVLPSLSGDHWSQRLLALQQWIEAYEEWKTWFARWHNRREPGWWSSRDRRQKPDPPAWLAETCAALLEDDGRMADGCRALQEWREDDYITVLVRREIVQSRVRREAQAKSAWWEHIHLDALWPMTQSGSRAFGVFGVHATLQLTRRVSVFLAPGAILMRVPSRDGGQTWSTATDWGFSYRMFDFRIPGTRRSSTVHANIARVWILGATATSVSGDSYLAGFSLTFKPPRTNLPVGR